MKYFITATTATSVLAVLLPLVTAAPANPSINARGSVCPFAGSNKYSIVTAADSNAKIRWDLFQDAGSGIAQNELAFDQEDQPDDPSLFTFLASTSGSDIFTIQRLTDGLQVASNGAGFNGVASGGTEFQVDCEQCLPDATSKTAFASGCVIQTTSQGTPSGQCAAYNGGTITPVLSQSCDTSQQGSSNSNQLFNIFLQ